MMGTAPRLGAMGAIAGGATAYVTADVTRVSRFAMDVRLPAVVVGALAGLFVGWILRAHLMREQPDASRLRRWGVPFATWVGGGCMASVAVVVGAHTHRGAELGSWMFAGIGIGVLGTVMSIPLCVWLTARARAARRARQGSLVARTDARAIVGGVLVCISLETLVLVPRWRDGFLEIADLPIAALVVSVTSLLAGILMVILDIHTSLEVTHLVARASDPGEGLTEREHGDEEGAVAPQVTDLGVGSEIFVRDEVGSTYRSGRSSVPKLRGAPEVAASLMRRAVMMSWMRLVLLVLPVAAHAFEASHPPSAWEAHQARRHAVADE